MGATWFTETWDKSGVREERVGRAWMSSNLGALEGESFARSWRKGETAVPVDIYIQSNLELFRAATIRRTIIILSYRWGKIENVGIGPRTPSVSPSLAVCTTLGELRQSFDFGKGHTILYLRSPSYLSPTYSLYYHSHFPLSICDSRIVNKSIWTLDLNIRALYHDMLNHHLSAFHICHLAIQSVRSVKKRMRRRWDFNGDEFMKRREQFWWFEFLVWIYRRWQWRGRLEEVISCWKRKGKT